MNRKGFSLVKYPIAILLFSMVVIGFYSVSNLGGSDSFWGSHGYSPPTNNVSKFNKIDDISQQAENLACDINPESDACPEKTGTAKTTIEKMVSGAYGALITIYKAFSIPKVLMESTLGEIGVPSIFINVAYVTLLLALVITIVLVIFNRSDTV